MELKGRCAVLEYSRVHMFEAGKGVGVRQI